MVFYLQGYVFFKCLTEKDLELVDGRNAGIYTGYVSYESGIFRAFIKEVTDIYIRTCLDGNLSYEIFVRIIYREYGRSQNDA